MIDNLWVILCSILVLTLASGLTLLYSGAVRAKNSVSLLVQPLILLCSTGLIWSAFGYRFVFGESSLGELDPNVHSLFQFTFYYVACLVPLGSIAERVKSSAAITFCTAWGLLVYLPVAYWIWNPNGWMAQLGAYDFAGGIVVHISSGVAGLVAAMVAGRRIDFFSLRLPFNVPQVYFGFILIALGWLGFNAGSLGGINESTGFILVNTLASAMTGMATWGLLQTLHPPNRTDILGLSFGGICGLVTVTPGAYGLDLLQSILLVATSTVFCFYIARVIRHGFRIDDSLEVFSSHAAAGLLGAIGVAAIGSTEVVGSQALYANVLSSVFVIIYSSAITFIITKTISKTFGFRVSKNNEKQGLDISTHGEKSLNL